MLDAELQPAPGTGDPRAHLQRGLALAIGALFFLPLLAPGPAQAATTHIVRTCADSGTDSLRELVASADSGDTIDLSELTCGSVQLEGEIKVLVDSLTIAGSEDRTATGEPVSGIRAGGAHRLLDHQGAGTLILLDLHLQDGQSHGLLGIPPSPPVLAEGGCVRSAGHVVLGESLVTNCLASDTFTNFPARGGAIYADGTVVAVGTTIRESKVSSTKEDALGGGIYAARQLILVDSRLEENEANTTAASGLAKGGGAYVPALWASNNVIGQSVISGNQATGAADKNRGHGGGLYLELQVDSQLTIQETQIIDNEVDGLGGGAVSGVKLKAMAATIANNKANRAGGLRAELETYLYDTTISDNQAKEVGGAQLGVYAPGTEVQLFQTTVSGNRATDSVVGAGLEILHNALLRNSTITKNASWNADKTKHGAGIALGEGIQLTLQSTIVSGNHTGQSGVISVCVAGCEDDIGVSGGLGAAPSVVGFNNLVGVCPLGLPADTIDEVNPRLGDLADNGGPTLTHMPQSDSAAIDSGANPGGYGWDQRGFGWARVVGNGPDIGAVEYGAVYNPDPVLFSNGFEDQP